MGTTNVPKASLLPPTIPPWFVPRSPDLLGETLARRLTVLVAGPGFGKSSTLAAWSATHPSGWYTVDGPDPARLVRGIVHALASRLPALSGVGASASAAASRGEVDEVVTMLVGALDAELDEDLALILDDLHELGRKGPAPAIIGGLIRQAPPELHVVLSSRSDPPIAIERLRGRGEVADIDSRSLAFSETEVATLLAHVDVDAVGLAASLHELTLGWPAAVRLAIETIRELGRAERRAGLARLPQAGGRLYAYLAKEVLAREPARARQLLELAAPLRRFTPELCAFLGARDPGADLDRLRREGLFLEARGIDDEWFSLHSLAREVLSRRPGVARNVPRLLKRAADWFVAHDYLDDAVRTLVAAGDTAAVKEIVRRHGTDLISRGHFTAVVDAADLVGEVGMDFEFRLLAAEAAMATGRVAWGTQQYARAAAGRAGLPANLVARMGLASLDRPSEALAILEAGMHASPRTADDAFVLGLAGQVAAVLGDLATAQGYAERGLALAQAHGWPWPEAEAALSLGLIAARRGDVELARAEYRTAGSAAERGGNVAQLATTAIRVATLLVASGRYSEAVGELDRGLDLAEAAGMPSLVAWGRSVRADAHLGLGRLDDAQIDAETARDIHERFGMTIVVRSLRCLGDVHRTRGELALARAAYEGALRRDSPDHRLDRAAALAGLARIVVAMDAEAGEALVCEATSLAEATPVKPFALLSAGWVSLWRGDPRGATRYAETAAAEARRRDGQPDIAESLELRAAALERPVDRLRLLDEAAELWRSLGNPLAMARVALAAARFSDRARAAAVAAAAEQQLRSLGVRLASVGGAAGLLAFVPWPDSAPVAIQTLGEFKVLRGGVPAGTGDWRRSRKAQQLLKILVTRRGRSLSRDALMEELWPETAPGDLTNRLSVALNTVRHVLDPDRRLPADHYVRSDGDRIAIDLSRLPIDLERFQALADGGLSLRERDPVNARQLLEAAEAAYAGDYLGGDLDNDSAAAVRDEALASYKRVARALAALATARGDRERVVHHLARMFERDPYDEAAHLELVAALVRFGERGEARRRYAAYVDRMAELATEPAPFPSDEPAPVTSRQV